jgi:transcriptional regulator with XRE-family HTH domain
LHQQLDLGANYADRLVPTVPRLALVLSEQERKERLAYWIRDTMDRRHLTPPKVAVVVGVSRSTVTAWAAGRQVPSLIYLGPLANALSVDPRLFADLPAIPPSGAAEYLVDTAASGIQEGLRRGRGRRAPRDLDTPAPSPKRRPRGSGAGRA